MTTTVLIAHKAGGSTALGVERGGDKLRQEFKAICTEGGRGFEAIELISSASGRIKRKSFDAVEKPESKITRKK